jgi:hypothetical protein
VSNKIKFLNIIQICTHTLSINITSIVRTKRYVTLKKKVFKFEKLRLNINVTGRIAVEAPKKLGAVHCDLNI